MPGAAVQANQSSQVFSSALGIKSKEVINLIGEPKHGLR